ncbi:putative PHP N-terminal domain protein [Vibrio nigripulchritudo FTn2]|uniref:anti-phage protein Ppl n=1 Tax=Vibrio nigripulchritudo TaxID=28173 RepID=UPI0003B18DF0|nr:anti-phage protein Ppl [Vibrio nigripulchritudo]CCN40177.1 putative PHP N-terminal domain protein [Vibrio nigripulchritudo FTn2]
MKPVGSSWFKVDFHCHSPGSDDYPKPLSSIDATSGCTPREWLLAQMNNEIDCVVLSDHNTGIWIDKVIDELAELRKSHHESDVNGFREITIIPAVELTAAGNCHVLGLFDESTKSEHISHVVGACGLDSTHDKGNHQTILRSGVPQVISEIKRAGGIAILAHIDKPKGIFSNTNQDEVRDAFKAQPDAVELIGNESDLNGFEKRLVDDLAMVKGTDSHCREDMGRSYTWVKMVSPSFSGIKVALTDPEHCIIRDAEPPRSPANKLTKLTLKTRMCLGKDDAPISVELSPWYTAIVGSRGSGKSTIIEAIRLASRRDTRINEPKLPIEIEQRLNDFRNVKEGAVTEDSSIVLDYSKDGHPYKLHWSPCSTKLERFEPETGKWLDDETFDINRFPVSIYSQKMLFDIATKPNAFLKVIDDSETVNVSNWKKEQDRLSLEYKSLSLKVRELDKQLDEIPRIRGALTDVDNKLLKLKSCGLSEAQEQQSKFQGLLSKADNPIKTMQNSLSDISEAVSNRERVVLSEEAGELLEWQKAVCKVQDDLFDGIGEHLAQAKKSIESLKKQPFYSELEEKVADLTHEMSKVLEELNDAEISPDELSELLSKKEELNTELLQEESLKDQRMEVDNKRQAIFKKLTDHRLELSNKRTDFIKALGLTDLDIKILPLACDSEELVSGYQSASGIDKFNMHILDVERDNTLLFELNKIDRFNPNNTSKRLEVLNQVKQYHRDVRDDKPNSSYCVHGSLTKKIEQLSEEQLDILECWFPEDGIEIRFQDEIGNKRPLDKASPGQKSASMLNFLLSYGTDPLILDQPEDDLDCAMLASTVIPGISQNKRRRQLVIVTHSAPLVVNGDAEQIVGMKQVKMRLVPNIAGGIQDQAVKDFVCDQMEGGKTAFRSRFKRIIG